MNSHNIPLSNDEYNALVTKHNGLQNPLRFPTIQDQMAFNVELENIIKQNSKNNDSAA